MIGRALRAGLSRLRRRAESTFVSPVPASIPSRLEFRPDGKGEFDELVARFSDGGAFIETMNDQSVYIDFSWNDGLHCQLWISCGGKAKLRYYHEDGQGAAPRFDAFGRPL